MIKNFLAIFFIFITMLSVQAYEDCIIGADGKLTNIQIKDNTMVDVCPVVTIMNEKNMLMVHPLKTGETTVCVLKDDKDIISFNIRINEDETIIEEVEGLEILTLDEPAEAFELDEPPMLKNKKDKAGEGKNG